MTTILTSVASAAVIGGDLIIGLSDGSIINCGRVVGPQGLRGDRGAVGDVGRPGMDGNTIHTTAGIPDTTLGKDGDYAINSRLWEIYGPKSAGQWGTATPLRGNKKGEAPTGRQEAIFGNDSKTEGGGGKAYNTSNLPLTGLGKTKGQRKVDAPGGNIIPEGNNLSYQSNLNAWIYNSLVALDKELPVQRVDDLPDEGEYEGDLVFSDGKLHVWTGGIWEEVGAEGGAILSVIAPVGVEAGSLWFCTADDDLTLYVYLGAEADQGWVPAAPPVSLEGIESAVAGVDALANEAMQKIGLIQMQADQTNEFIKWDQERQDGEIKSLEQEIEGIVPSFDRGVYGFTDKLQDLASANGGYFAIVSRFVTPMEMCNTLLGKCQEAAGEDVSAKSQCNKDYTACLEAIDGEDGDAPILSSDWHDAQYLWIDLWDKRNELHTFRDAKAGKYIELTNSDGSGNMVALIDEDRIEIDPGLSQVKVNVLSWKGKPSGDARIKLFEISAADPTGYIRKGSVTDDGTETKVHEFLYGTRIDFKGETSFVKIRDKAYVSAYENNTLKAKMSVLGLFSNVEQPPAEDPHSTIWVPNITQIEERFDKGPVSSSHLTHTFLWEYIEGGEDAAPTMTSGQFTQEKIDSEYVLFFSVYLNGVPYGPWNQASHTADYGFASINNWNGRFAYGMWATRLLFCRGKKINGKDHWWNEIRGDRQYGASNASYDLKPGRKYHASLPAPWPVVAFPESVWKNTGATSFEVPEPEDLGDPLPE